MKCRVKIVASLVLGACISGCNLLPQTYSEKDINQEYTYIDLSETTPVYSHTDTVLGQKQDVYQIIGLKGEHYVISVDSADNKAQCHIEGEGVMFYTDPLTKKTSLEVVDESGWVRIIMSSEPQSTYLLRVVLDEMKIDWPTKTVSKP